MHVLVSAMTPILFRISTTPVDITFLDAEKIPSYYDLDYTIFVHGILSFQLTTLGEKPLATSILRQPLMRSI